MLLILGASGVGLPVATTHVSCGAIFGIGLARRSANPRTILGILAAWLTTMPLAAILGMAIARAFAVGDSLS